AQDFEAWLAGEKARFLDPLTRVDELLIYLNRTEARVEDLLRQLTGETTIVLEPQVTQLSVSIPIGYRFAEKWGQGDRIFRYCVADSALIEKRGAGNGDTLHETTTALVAEAGDQDLTVVIAAADAAYVADQFKDGYLNVWAAMGLPNQPCLKIKGNDASDGTNVVLHLEEPLTIDVPVGSGVDIHENIYRSTLSKSPATPFASVVAVPLVPVLINYFYWGQVWGPCVGIAHALGGLGA
ncbi:unnamed protein product, partial [marine sediment metagenome]